MFGFIKLPRPMQLEIQRVERKLSRERRLFIRAKTNDLETKEDLRDRASHHFFVMDKLEAELLRLRTLQIQILCSLRGVAVPEKTVKSPYWAFDEREKAWVLKEAGFEHLEIKLHEAFMRKSERFQSWFTPSIALIALVLSIVSLLQPRVTEDTVNKPKVQNLPLDPQQQPTP